MHWKFILAAILARSRAVIASRSCTVLSNSTTACGVFGRVKYDAQPSYANADPQFVASVSECAALCAQRRYNSERHQTETSYCRSFLYEQESNLCQLGALTVEDAVTAKEKAPRVFYDIDCFDCGALCPHGYGEQLLDNGGFEERLLGPWSTSLARIGKGKDSSRGYHCKYPDAVSCELTQQVNMCFEHVYELTADYRAVAKSQKGTFFQAGAVQDLFMTYDDWSNFTAEDTPWKSLRLFVRATPSHVGPYFTFDGISGTAGDYHVDNVKFTRFPTQLKVISGNYIRNGGFESGVVFPWTTDSNDFTIVSPGINSSHGILLTSIANEQGEANLRQTVNTEPNKLYRLSFNAVVKDAEFFFSVFIGPRSGQAGYTYGWKHGNHSFSIPYYAKTAKTLIRISISELFIQGTFLLDNFKMTEVGEPFLA